MLIKPTAEQSQILQSTRPVLMLQSIAGSAKTTTLAAKAISLIEGKTNPSSILLLCYTAAGVVSIRERLAELGLSRAHLGQVNVLLIDNWGQYILKVLDGPEGAKNPVPYLQDADNSLAFGLARRALYDVSEMTCFDGQLVDTFHQPQTLSQFFQLLEALKADPLSSLFEIIYQAYPDFESLAQQLNTSELMLHWAHAYEKRRTVIESRAEDIPAFRLPSDCIYDVLRYLNTGYEIPGKITEGLRFVGIDEAHDMTPAFVELVNCCRFPRAQVAVVGDPRQRVFASASGTFVSLSHLTVSLGNRVGNHDFLPLSYSLRFGSNIAKALQELSEDRDIKGVARPPGFEDQVFFTSTPGNFEDLASQVHAILHTRCENDQEANKSPTSNQSSLKQLMVIVPQEQHVPAAALALAFEGIAFTELGKTTYKQFAVRPEMQLVKFLLLLITPSAQGLGKAMLYDAFDFAKQFFAFRELGSKDPDYFSYNSIRETIAECDKTLFQMFTGPQFISDYVRQRVQGLSLVLKAVSEELDTASFLSNSYSILQIERWIKSQYSFEAEAQAAWQSLKYIVELLKSRGFSSFEVLSYLDRISRGGSGVHLGQKVLLACATSAKGYQAETVVVGPLSQVFWDVRNRTLELNRLYVAMSRAKNNLYLLLPDSDSLALVAKPFENYRDSAFIDINEGVRLADLTDVNSKTAPGALKTFELYCSPAEHHVIEAHGATWNRAKRCWVLRSDFCPDPIKKYLRQ